MRKLTIEGIKERLKIINPNIEILSEEYIDAKTKLKCRCKIDNYEWEMNWNKLQSGRGCHLCAGNIKLNINEIKTRLKNINPNIVIMSNKYYNNETKLQCKCLVCENEWETCWSSLQQEHGCKKCGIKKVSDGQRFNLDMVKEKLRSINPNIEIISNEYYNNETELKCKCKIDGYIWNSTWCNLQTGNGCAKCSNNAKLNLEEIKKALTIINPNIEILSNTYVNSFNNLECRCKIDGYEWNAPWTNLRVGHGCKICGIKNNSGENSHLWKGGITPISIYLRQSIKQWKIESFEQANYKCCITGISKNLEIHHIHNFADIVQETFKITNLKIHDKVSEYSNKELELLEKVCLELHYKYGLGVCLTKKLHEEFHKKYGYGNNTLKQFEEFKDDYRLGGERYWQELRAV